MVLVRCLGLGVLDNEAVLTMERDERAAGIGPIRECLGHGAGDACQERGAEQNVPNVRSHLFEDLGREIIHDAVWHAAALVGEAARLLQQQREPGCPPLSARLQRGDRLRWESARHAAYQAARFHGRQLQLRPSDLADGPARAQSREGRRGQRSARHDNPAARWQCITASRTTS
jgi:hypothetical protein